IGPLWIVPIALLLEWAAAWLEGWATRTAALAAAALVLLLAVQLQHNIRWRRALYPYSYETSFGRVAFHDPEEFTLLDAIARQVKEVPSRELFTFPGDAALSLVTDSINPTPYQILMIGYSEQKHFDEVIDDLERKEVPFIAYSP